MATLVGRSLGRYSITGVLGEGGMGVVFKARDTRLKRDVAVKVIKGAAAEDRHRVERFKREARAVAQLSHPNILEIFDFGFDEGVFFAVMELLEGHSLQERMREGRLPVRDAITIARQTAEGLNAAHGKGIVHRDIKPENIFITGDRRIKILDFGLAHLKGAIEPIGAKSGATATLTESGAVVGTPRFMSPEQIRGLDVDGTSDLFSLGCVTYQMIAGKHPFQRDTGADTIAAILNEDPEPMGVHRSGISPALEDLVLRCLDKNPEERFHSAHDLGCALQAVGDSRSWSGRYLRRRRFPLSIRALATAAVGAVVMLAVLLVGQSVRNLRGPAVELPSRLHLGVAPFSASGDSEHVQATADGIATDIARRITVLERQAEGRLWVVEPEHIWHYELEDCAAIHRLFNTTVCLTGALKRRDDGLSLTLELKDGANGETIARQAFESRVSNIAVLQTEPAFAVARMLRLVFATSESSRLQTVPTNVTSAYIAALRGTGLLVARQGPEATVAAVELLEQAVEADPLFQQAWNSLGRACQQRFRETGERDWLDRGFTCASKASQLRRTPESLFLLAGLRAAENDTQGEVEALQEAVQLDPTAACNYRRLALALRRNRQLSEAIDALQRAINLRPGYWIYEHDLASLYYARGEYDSAANHWRRVTECAPLFDGGYANLGIANFLLGRTTMAKRNFERAIELNPRSNVNTYLNLGSLYFADAQFADAASAFETALELDDDSYVTWGNLGFSLAYGMEPERAELALTRAVELAEGDLEKRADDVELLSDLAGYHAALEHEEKTREYLKRAIALGPADPEVLATIGESFEDIGERGEALVWIERAFDAGAQPIRFETRPTLRGLINDPRYRALTTGANSRDRSNSESS